MSWSKKTERCKSIHVLIAMEKDSRRSPLRLVENAGDEAILKTHPALRSFVRRATGMDTK